MNTNSAGRRISIIAKQTKETLEEDMCKEVQQFKMQGLLIEPSKLTHLK